MSVETQYPHIGRDERGAPLIEGTSLKVIELVAEKLAYGWSPEELHFQHPYLTLGQIHSALACYWHHLESMDREVNERLQRVESVRHAAKRQPSPLLRRIHGQRPR